MKRLILLWCMFLTVPIAFGQGVQPDAGFVPNAETAVRIGEAVLIPVYGVQKIESERPFHAELKDGAWTVGGTLRCPDGRGGTTTSCVGGAAVVKIAKADGRIIFMTHYK